MSEFRIEKGVPLVLRRDFKMAEYPFHDMEVGDSFQCDRKSRDRCRQAAFQYGKRHGKQFATRTMPDGFIRIWRTA